jgi:hypothetical protein
MWYTEKMLPTGESLRETRIAGFEAFQYQTGNLIGVAFPGSGCASRQSVTNLGTSKTYSYFDCADFGIQRCGGSRGLWRMRLRARRRFRRCCGAVGGCDGRPEEPALFIGAERAELLVAITSIDNETT